MASTKQKTWYEKAGFKENPFTIKPNEEYLLDSRKKIIDDIIQSVADTQICALVGEYGLGKTSILRGIIRHYRGRKRVIYFSCNRLTGPLDVDKLLYDRLAITHLLKIRSKKMILLLDEVEYLSPADFANIEKYHDEGYFSAVVMVTNQVKSIPSQVVKLDHVYTLTSLTAKQAVELVTGRIGDSQVLTDSVIEHIYKIDSRIRRFLKNCEHFMRYMHNHKRTSAKSSDVAKVFSEN